MTYGDLFKRDLYQGFLNMIHHLLTIIKTFFMVITFFYVMTQSYVHYMLPAIWGMIK